MNPRPKQQQDGPLGPAHLKLLDRVIKSCAETEAYCDKCEQCHIDVSNERQKNREQMEIASRIKARFFPHAH